MDGVSGAHATGGLIGGNSGRTRSRLFAGNGGGGIDGDIGVSCDDELELPAAFAGGSGFELKSGSVASSA